MRRATPSAARSAIPPNEPTRAGTRGTTGDGVSVVDEGVVEVLVDEGRPPAVGVAGVGGTHVKPSVEVDRVLQLDPEAVVVMFVKSGIVVTVPLIVSVLFKTGVGAGVAENVVVRFPGSVSTISVGLIVAEEDIGTVGFSSNELDAVASAADKVPLTRIVPVPSGIEVCEPVVTTEEIGALSAVAVPSTAEVSVPVSDVVRPVSMAGTTAVKEESTVSGISPEEAVGKMEPISVIGKVAVIFAIGI